MLTELLKFHPPGLAPCSSEAGAFHINKNGSPAYPKRFLAAFGFYDLLAAVRDEKGWFHIHPDGSPLYETRYEWCGNFQEQHCPVKDKGGFYFHINSMGIKAYSEKYPYVGDFKDGFAVVCNPLGLHTHINCKGEYLHAHWFLDLDVFHKGYARAKDEKGWFHINTAGEPLYKMRYAMIEPFYNGISRVETYEGALITINVQGKKIQELRPPTKNDWQSLSSDMVGFWKTEIIAAAIKLKILDYLPDTTSTIASYLKTSEKLIERLLRALWELQIVNYKDNYWNLTEKGRHLSSEKENFLVGAAIMWSDVNHLNWKSLDQLIATNYDNFHPVFKTQASDEKLASYHQAIDGYAKSDFSFLTDKIDWNPHKKIIGIGRSAKNLLENLLLSNPSLEAMLLGEEYIFKHFNFPSKITARYHFKVHDLLNSWPEKADAIIFPRILHYWPNKQALQILNHARKALLPDRKIYILEMLLEKENAQGSLLDINMLIESGGQLRYLSEWEQLSLQAKLTLKENIPITSYLNLLVFHPQ